MKEHKSELCMFCSKEIASGELTREHFVPKGLWAGARPKGTRTHPAHVKCNAQYAADNEYFRDVLISDERQMSHPEVEKIRGGKFARKMEKQLGSVSKLYKNLRIIDVFSPGGVFLRRAPAFEVDTNRINRVLCNVVRGVFYEIEGHPVPENCFVGILPSNMRRDPAILELIAGMGPINTFGDDVFMCRTNKHREKQNHLVCLLRFYRSHEYFGFVTPQDVDCSNPHEDVACVGLKSGDSNRDKIIAGDCLSSRE